MIKYFFSLLLLVVFYSCKTEKQAANDTKVSPSEINSVINANNKFALNLYSQLKDDDENIFFSPYSISSAIAMTYEGAKGQTAQEIQSVFGFPTDNNSRRGSFAEINNQINKSNSHYKLDVANALWLQEDYEFSKTYLSNIKKYYDSDATTVDFKNNTEKSRKMINQWVENKTNNKIKDLFPAGSLDKNSRLVLTNAIYFKGDWMKAFKKNNTRKYDFKLSSGRKIQVPMMSEFNEKFSYTQERDVQVLELPYKGDKLSMLLVLPKGDLSSFESSLTLNKINNWKNKLKKTKVYVSIPKFKFGTKYSSMSKVLEKMGIKKAFTTNADFSGIDNTKNLYLKKVVHKAFIEVNEEGTEAAASTGVSLGVTSLPPSFRADRPFIFIIQDKSNGNILFIGRVSNPTKG